MPQPPTITLQSPKDYIFDPRENIVIHCEAKGKPHPRWDIRSSYHIDACFSERVQQMKQVSIPVTCHTSRSQINSVIDGQKLVKSWHT